jgi:hypothetical protein
VVLCGSEGCDVCFMIQNDQDRKVKSSFVELSSAEVKKAEGAREYKAAFKANKQKLSEKLKDRPSLMERHTKVLAHTRIRGFTSSVRFICL